MSEPRQTMVIDLRAIIDFEQDASFPLALRAEQVPSNSIKPEKAIASAAATSHYVGPGLPKVLVDFKTDDAALLAMVGIQRLNDGSLSLLPRSEAETIPVESCCHHCGMLSMAAFAPNSLGCGISWPPLRSALSLECEVGRNFIDAIIALQAERLPQGYCLLPSKMELCLSVTFEGRALR